DLGAIEHAAQLGAEIVGVAVELAAGLVGDVEEDLLAVGAAAAARLLDVGAQAADVDRLHHAIGAAEALEHGEQLALYLGVAEAAVAVGEPDLAKLDVELRLLGLGARRLV